MRTLCGLTLAIALASPAFAQTPTTLTCGALKAESWKTSSTTHWTISLDTEKTAEKGMLRSGPRFECIAGSVLAVEFAAATGQAFLGLYFPDGNSIGYGGQHLVRNGRFVLPVQAKQRIPQRFQSAFDYHCRLELPADPISAAMRADCSN